MIVTLHIKKAQRLIQLVIKGVIIALLSLCTGGCGYKADPFYPEKKDQGNAV